MLSKVAIEEFGGDLHGDIILENDAAYDSARKVWNGLIDKRPALIVECKDESDVLRAVNFARDYDVLAAVRGGGHNVAGFSTCDNGIVIDLSGMKEISVDSTAQTVKAQAGLTWGEFDKATQAHGLATTGGLVSETGIAGFTLGGGIGWLMRKQGLTIDNLLAVELITADGRRVVANSKENPDLFWGVRGGGGNFGIVTSFTFRLQPVGPTVLGGALFYPIERARDLLRLYAGWARALPDELTSMVAFVTAPPAPFMPQHLQGTPMIAVALCHCGPLKQGEALLKPLRENIRPAVDAVGPMPYLDLQKMFDAGVPKGILSYWKTEYLRDLDDRTIDKLIAHAGMMGKPFAQVHVHHLEGAITRVKEDATAFSHRDAPFVLNIVGEWTDPAETENHIAWARNFSKAVQPFSTGSPYINFLGDEGEGRIRAAYGEKKYMRLVALKNKYDRRNFFRLNQNIRPSA